MCQSILLILILFCTSIASTGDYFRKGEIFVLAGPMDNLDEGDAPGQFGGGFAYHFTPRIGADIYFSRGSMSHEYQYPEDPETGDPGYTSHSTETIQMVSTRFLFHFSKGRFKTYSALGTAIVNIRNKGNDLNFGQGPPEIFFDEANNHFAFDCNLGMKYHFTPAFSVGSELGSIFLEQSLLRLTFNASYHF
jgi:hypothetical protein